MGDDAPKPLSSSDVLVTVLNDPGLRGRLQRLGLEPIGSMPAQLAAVQKADFEKWAKPVRPPAFRRTGRPRRCRTC
jgi:hypothetical protein